MRYLFFLMILLTATCATAQPFAATPFPILNDYIEMGLGHNLTLQQAELTAEQSKRQVTEARGLLLPSVTFQSRYTRADGGRTIEFPVGDLLNPVYTTLNQLTGAATFPTIDNEQIDFLREEEHDTKLTLTQHLFNPKIYYTLKARQQQASAEKAALTGQQRVLIRDIKIGYFDYLKADRAVAIYEQALVLAEENQRVSQSLFDNDQVTRDAVYRAETEYYRVQQQLRTARNQADLARSAFNALLNRPLDAMVTIDSSAVVVPDEPIDLAELQQTARAHRPEFQQIDAAIAAADNGRKAQQGDYWPNLLLSADYGYQGESYELDTEADYWLVSGVVQWNLFNGLSDKARADQARLETRKLKLARADLDQQIAMQVDQSYYNLITARDVHETAQLAVRSAGENLRMVQKKYAAGTANQIEYVDAQTTYTSAQVQAAIATFDVWQARAELDYAIGR